jgi:hypothetical protein
MTSRELVAFAGRCVNAYIGSLAPDDPERVAYEAAMDELRETCDGVTPEQRERLRRMLDGDDE